MKPPPAHVWRWLTSLLGKPARRAAIARAGQNPGRIIELGIGDGGTIGRLAPGTGHVGVDWRADPLEIAAARAARRAPAGFEGLVMAAPGDLPFEDGAFDAALSSMSIAETADPPAALAELVRVVRAGGDIVIVGRFAGDEAPAPDNDPGPGAGTDGITALISLPGVTMTTMRRLPPLGLFTLICFRVEAGPETRELTAGETVRGDLARRRLSRQTPGRRRLARARGRAAALAPRPRRLTR